MKSLIAAASLLLQGDATQEETSLMQGPVARRGQMSPEAPQDASTKLMETATKLIKNGATPDVVGFIEDTIEHVNDKVLSVIVDEHNLNQEEMYEFNRSFWALKKRKDDCAAQISLQTSGSESATNEHKACRSAESLACARSRRCEEQLEERWHTVKREEEEMRRIHWAIHGEWCEPGPPVPPSTSDPFRWNPLGGAEGWKYWEADETSQSRLGGWAEDPNFPLNLRGPQDKYPPVDLTAEVTSFREFSVTFFGHYITQRPVVETAWEQYNKKLLECAALEETWTLKVDECDALQDALHAEACSETLSSNQCAVDFGYLYERLSEEFRLAVGRIQVLERDRKREWETLHIVTCLLETVYTHVIHAIDSGEPCPTEESHPEQTAAEINTCHIVEESFTANLTIWYPTPPLFCDDPANCGLNVEDPPCTAEYIWEETGSFPAYVIANHRKTIQDEGLGDYFADLSDSKVWQWAGCAAPKACTPCSELVDDFSLQMDSTYEESKVCKMHQTNLAAGQMDSHTFKCLTGNQCLPANHRCNGLDECGDKSDEVGCNNPWDGGSTVLGTRTCNTPFSSDVQFSCATGGDICIDASARCDGVDNCPDKSDEQDCSRTSTGLESTWTAGKIPGKLEVEAMTGRTAAFEIASVDARDGGSAVFRDRSYTFTDLGSFAGFSFLKMYNEDKHIRNSHVQVKLRLPKPLKIYVVKLGQADLPWLNKVKGWTEEKALTGVKYSGMPADTMHTEWRNGHDWANYERDVLVNGAEHFSEHHKAYDRRHEALKEEDYEAGQVWSKVFPAGAVEMRGNNGGAGSYLIFVADPAQSAQHLPQPVGAPADGRGNQEVVISNGRGAKEVVGPVAAEPEYTFWVTETSGTWEAARQECIAGGGDLAMMKTEEKAAKVNAFALASNIPKLGSDGGPWLGFHNCHCPTHPDWTSQEMTALTSAHNWGWNCPDGIGCEWVDGSTLTSEVLDKISGWPDRMNWGDHFLVDAPCAHIYQALPQSPLGTYWCGNEQFAVCEKLLA